MKAPKIVKKAQAGFTLIELMIVVAIIGILAAVAIPAYQNYVAKSKFAGALSEVAGAKTAYDTYMNDGKDITAVTDVGLSATDTANCTFGVAAANAGMTCTIVGGPVAVKGKIITLSRDPNGIWTCTANVAVLDQDKVIGPVGVCKATG